MTNSLELENLQGSEHETSVENRTGEQIVSEALEEIDNVEERLADSGIPRGTAESINAVDEFLADNAEYELSSPDAFTKQQRKAALGNVFIETAIEQAHGVPADQTAIAKFDTAKYPGELSDLLDSFKQTHVVEPSGLDVDVAVMKTVDELADHPVMGETSAKVEFISNNEVKSEKETTIDAAVERAERAAEAGVERSEFQGPEVREAIKSYYLDHEVALTAIEAITDGEMSDVDKRKLTESSQEESNSPDSIFSDALKASIRLDQLDDKTQRNTVLAALLSDVYKEPSIGQRTLDEAAIDELARRKADLKTMLVPSLARDQETVVVQEKASIVAAQEAAQNETRDAGQLLFHNTVYGRDVVTNNSLRGRLQQGNIQDKINISTREGEDRSHVTHWSEVYDPIGYKQILSDNAGVEQAKSMTLAVPLGEVIKTAPIARGLEYATVEAKRDRSVEVSDIGHDGKKVVGEIGAGAPDTVGHNIPSVDRVFWASTDSMSEGSAYDVPIGGKDIMKIDPLTGIEVPVVYAIQSDSDRLRNYNDASKKSDADKIMEWQKDIGQLSQRDFLNKHGESIDGPGSGTGFGYANRINIQDIQLGTETPAAQLLQGGGEVTLGGSDQDPDVRKQAAQAEPYIRQIEKESIDRFKGSYVVPLRTRTAKFDMTGADNAVANLYGSRLNETLARVA